MTILTFMKVVRDNPEFGNRAKHCIIAALLVFLGFALIWNAFAKSTAESEDWHQTQSDIALAKHRKDIEAYLASQKSKTSQSEPEPEKIQESLSSPPVATSPSVAKRVATLTPRQEGQYTVAIAPGFKVDLTDGDLDQALGINQSSAEIRALAEEVRIEKNAQKLAMETIVVEALPEFTAPQRPDLELQNLFATLDKIEKPFLHHYANRVSVSLNDVVALTLLHAGWIEDKHLTVFEVVSSRPFNAASNGAEVFADKLQNDDSLAVTIQNKPLTQVDFSKINEHGRHKQMSDSSKSWEIHYGALASPIASPQALRVVPSVEEAALSHPVTHAHLGSVANAYWQLYRARAMVVLAQQNLESLKQWLDVRRESESEDNKLRLAKRKRDLERAMASVKQAQSQLAQLVGHRLLNTGSIEIVPSQRPSLGGVSLDLAAQVSTAISNRDDIENEVDRLKTSISRFAGDQQALLQSLVSRITNPDQPELMEDGMSQLAAELAQGPNRAIESVEIEVKLACQELERVEQGVAELRNDVDALFNEYHLQVDDLNAFVDIQDELQVTFAAWLEQSVELQGALQELKRVTGTLVFERTD